MVIVWLIRIGNQEKNCELFPKFNRLLFKMNIYFKKTIDIKNKIWRAT